jgi:hypothetical protein
MEIGIVSCWFLLAIVVGVAASVRGRNGFGWFLLAAVLSPLIAGLLVLALPRPSAVFRPDGMLGQTPFRQLPNGQVEAMLQGAPVRFRNIAEMQMMVDPGASIVSSAPPPKPPPPFENIYAAAAAFGLFALIVGFFVWSAH